MSDFSILTNSGASIALNNLSTIDTQLNTVQNQVSTGLKVSGATDNAGVFAVAQGIRANLKGFDAVNTSLNDASGVANVALAGVTSVSNLLSDIQGTLTSLSDNSISDAERQSYTSQLKSQIDEVQTFINGANYNGVNIVAASQGTYAVSNAGFTDFSSAANVSVLAGVNGNSLTVHSVDLTGGTAGTDGFLGLARLVYFSGTASDTTGDTVSSNHLFTNASGLVSRSEIAAVEAQAALAAAVGSTAATNAYTSTGGTVGTSSVFNSALALFTNQVNSALGSLGADSNNIQLQITFNQTISDAINTGLGNLVDANLATASAQLTALQTQQQLATQALSIANSQPSVILDLFKNG